MESSFQYRLTLKAKADLDHIASYIAVNLSNPQAASKFIDHLYNAIEDVCSFPESGTIIDNIHKFFGNRVIDDPYISNEKVRMKIIDNYNMYYFPHLEQKTIYVLRILYNKRNISDMLLQLDF